MIKITKFCKVFYKKPAEFLDNKHIKELLTPENHKVSKGALGGTEIHEDLFYEFLLWLSPQTRQMLSNGMSLSEVTTYLNKLKKGDIDRSDVRREYSYSGHNSANFRRQTLDNRYSSGKM